MDRQSLLAGTHAVVTGGAVNIGRAITQSLARAGARVTILYHTSRDEAALTAEELTREGAFVDTVEADIQDEDHLRAAFREAGRRYGEIDILVNNAGIFHLGLQDELDRYDWDRVFEITTRSVFLCSREVLPSMKNNRKGSIVNIASINALQPGFGKTAHYDAAKAAVAGYTRSLAAEVGPFGIRVNAVAPGLTDSARLRRDAPDLIRHYEQRSPLGRLVQDRDIASAVLFFASSESSAVTGTILPVDCGYMLT